MTCWQAPWQVGAGRGDTYGAAHSCGGGSTQQRYRTQHGFVARGWQPPCCLPLTTPCRLQLCCAGRRDLVAAVRDMHIMLGAVLDPHAAFLLLRGMKTLELRVMRQNATALEIARRLEAHPQVTAGGSGVAFRRLHSLGRRRRWPLGPTFAWVSTDACPDGTSSSAFL